MEAEPIDPRQRHQKAVEELALKLMRQVDGYTAGQAADAAITVYVNVIARHPGMTAFVPQCLQNIKSAAEAIDVAQGATHHAMRH